MLILTRNLLLGMSGHFIVTIFASTGQQAQSVVADTTAPALVSFHLNMITNKPTLTFSEVVDISSIAPSRSHPPLSLHPVLLNLQMVRLMLWRTLVAPITLTTSDLNNIKEPASNGTMYFVVAGNALTDMSSNAVSPIASSAAFKATACVADAISLQQLSFPLDSI